MYETIIGRGHEHTTRYLHRLLNGSS